jgi:parallel beta-helix repeat protein
MRKLLGLGLVAALAAVFALSAAPALGNHIQCGDVITQDTTLDSDLVDCPGAGVVIGSDDVTLNLGGHKIDGRGIHEGELDEDPVGYGIDNRTGHASLTIRNGTVQEFYHGIQLNSVTGNRIHQLTLVRNDVAIEMNGSGNRIDRNTIVDGWDAMGLAGHGNLIERNSLIRNQNGISLSSGEGNVLRWNSIADSRFAADGGGVTGIGLYFADRNQIEMNSVSGQQLSYYFRTPGISLLASSHNTIRKNELFENGFGILLGCYGPRGSTDNVIEKNSASRNTTDGIAISTGLGAGYCKFGGGGVERSGGNILFDNVLDGNLKDGLYIDIYETDNVLTRNGASGNGDDGIDVDEPISTIRHSRAEGNGDWGIEAVTGTTDGGGNRAFGNGNPLQCLNISCK